MWTSSIIVHAFPAPLCYNEIDKGADPYGKELRYEQHIVFFDAQSDVRVPI